MATIDETTINTKTTTPKEEETEVKPRRRSNSFASLLERAANMASGIGAHQAELAAKGLNDETIQHINKLVQDSTTLGNEQEILKSQLKEKTAALEGFIKELRDQLKRCNLIVNVAVPRMRWVDFGMSDRR